MNVLPRLIISTPPLPCDEVYFKIINSFFSSFIWNGKRAKISITKLFLVKWQNTCITRLISTATIHPIPHCGIATLTMKGKSLENEEWERKGISSLMHLFTEGVMMSFDQLKSKFDLTSKDFWLYLQIRSQLTQFLGELIKPLEITNTENNNNEKENAYK